MAQATDERCVYCGGGRPGSGRLIREHLIPRSRGGDDSPENTAPACAGCNSSKRDMTPLEWYMVEYGLWRREHKTPYRAGRFWLTPGLAWDAQNGCETQEEGEDRDPTCHRTIAGRVPPTMRQRIFDMAAEEGVAVQDVVRVLLTEALSARTRAKQEG